MDPEQAEVLKRGIAEDDAKGYRRSRGADRPVTPLNEDFIEVSSTLLYFVVVLLYLKISK